jgi:hypothetical protein
LGAAVVRCSTGGEPAMDSGALVAHPEIAVLRARK